MRRRRRRRDIVIELTSLLDVIMIIIFMVMKQNSTMIVEKQNTIDAVKKENASQTLTISEMNSKADELQNQLDEAQGKLDETQGKLDELNGEDVLNKLQAAENKLASYEAIDDVVIVLNIGLENKYNNTVRTLTYGKVSEQSSVIDNHTDEEFEVSMNKMRVFIGEYITKVLNDKNNETIVYVVFTYDPTKVYERDYEAIGEALKDADINANNGNFRYRINPTSGN